MKRNTLLALAAAAVVLVGWAIWLAGSSGQGSDTERRQLLVPELSGQLESIERVRITGAGASTLVTLARGESGWEVAERDGWPADVGQLRGFLLGLSQARKLEAKTALSQNYRQLGVEDLAESDSKGVHLDLDWPDASRSLIIGLNNPNGNGSYVRVPGQAQSWLTDANLAVERNPARGLSRSLLSIPQAELQSLILELPGEKTLQLTRTPSSDADAWALTPLPDGREANQTALAGAAGFVDGLRLDDVQRADAPEDVPERIATFLRRDGLRLTLRLWPDPDTDGQVGTMPWAAIDVDVDDAQAQAYHAAEWEKDQRALAAAVEPTATAPDGDRASGGPTEAEPSDEARRPADGGAQVAAGSMGDVPTESPVGAGDRPVEGVAGQAGGIDAPSTLSVDARIAATQTEAQALEAKVDGWLFKLPAFKLANLRRDHHDFLTPES